MNRQLAIQRSLDLAVQRHVAGNFSEAENGYRKILEADPDNRSARHLLAVIADQADKSASALEVVAYAEPYNNLGVALNELGRPEDAVASYLKALAIKPDYAEAHGNMGTALLELERLDDAVASYRKTLVIKPDYAEAHCKMGNALMKLLWLDDAIASYQKALVIEPDYAEALNNLGKALQDLGQVEDAVANFRKALAVNPDSSVGNYNLGLALQELGQLDEAAERFNRASELKPDFAEAHRQLGNTLLIMGNLPSAINAYRLVVETRPDDSDLSLFFMGVIHDLLGETEHATGLFDRIHSDYKNSNHMVDSWKYANRHEVESTPLFSTRRDTLALALEHATVEGMMLEFGVSFGTSLKYIASMTDQPVHGFDSFEGLPEDWESIPADSFSTRGRLPDVPPNV